MTSQAVALKWDNLDLGPHAESKLVTFTGSTRMAPAAEAMRTGNPGEGARIFLAVTRQRKDIPPEEKAGAFSGHALTRLQQRDIAGYLNSTRDSLSVLRKHAPSKLWQETLIASNILIDFADRIGGVEAARGALDLLGEFPTDDTTDLNNALGRAWLACARQESEPDTTHKAIAAFKAAIRTAPHAAKLRVQINLAEAQRLLAEQTSDVAHLDSAITILEGVVSAVPLATLHDGPRSREVLGLARADRSLLFERDGFHDEALKERRAAIAALGEASNGYRTARDWEGLVKCFNGLGTVHRDGKQFEDAERVYGEAETILRSQSGKPRPLSLARIRHNQGDIALGAFAANREQWSPDQIERALAAAIDGFAEAAELRRFVVPLDCARSTAALAESYFKRGDVRNGDVIARDQGEASPAARADYERAIQCYRDAIPDLDQPECTQRCLELILALTSATRGLHDERRHAYLFQAEIAWLSVRSFKEIPELKGLITATRTKLDNEITTNINEYRLYLEHMANATVENDPARANDLAAFQSDLDALLSARVHDETRRAAIMAIVERAITAPLDDANHLALVSGVAESAWADSGKAITKPSEGNRDLHLPDKAPSLYENRPKGQNIVDYLRDPRGWGPYVSAGIISRPDLKRLDPKAYKAVENWLLHDPLPDDLPLLKKSDVTDLIVARTPTAGNLPAHVLAALRERQMRKMKIG